nr:hypothetical protein [uncultured Halomonas sp.]
MRAAIIKDGIVANIAKVADEDFAQSQGWIVSDTAKIGDSYDAETGKFTTSPPPPEPIPTSITPRQARLALLQAGLLSQVDTAIASLESPAKEQAQIEWEYATSIERSSEWINQLGSALGLDATGIDDLFKTASTL